MLIRNDAIDGVLKQELPTIPGLENEEGSDFDISEARKHFKDLLEARRNASPTAIDGRGNSKSAIVDGVLYVFPDEPTFSTMEYNPFRDGQGEAHTMEWNLLDHQQGQARTMEWNVFEQGSLDAGSLNGPAPVAVELSPELQAKLEEMWQNLQPGETMIISPETVGQELFDEFNEAYESAETSVKEIKEISDEEGKKQIEGGAFGAFDKKQKDPRNLDGMPVKKTAEFGKSALEAAVSSSAEASYPASMPEYEEVSASQASNPEYAENTCEASDQQAGDQQADEDFGPSL